MKRWPKKQLGQLLKVQNGFAFKSEYFNEDGKGLPIVRIRDLKTGSSETFYDGEHDAAFEIKNGDLLIGMDGEFRCYRWEGGKALLNQRVCRLQDFSQDINPSYVFYGINDTLRQIEDNTAFATVKHISSKQIASIETSVPPLLEQERIVRLLDEAEELRMLRAQGDDRAGALIPALFYKMFGDAGAGGRKPLGEVCLKITDGVHITPTYVNDGVPFLRVTDIQGDEVEWSTVKHIPEAEYEEITKRVKPELGDVLYSKNGTIGIAKEITWKRPFAHFVSLALLKPNRKVLNSTFLTTWLNTPDALEQAIGRSKTGTVTNLHLNEIRKMRIPCPSKEEQGSFVRQAVEIRALEARQSASRARLAICSNRCYIGRLTGVYRVIC